MNDECIVEINGLWTCFGETVVHRDIDLCVHRGEVLVLVGGSGSGKTVLIRQMLGLETPTRGEVRVFGHSLQAAEPAELARMRTRWGVFFQGGALFSALSVFENVALPLRERRRLDEEMIRDVVVLKLETVGIEAKHANKMPAELSGGMVRRVGLARAIALEPELLFLDEPTAGLDPDRSEAVVKLIEALHRELRLTVVLATHDLDAMVALSDRVAVLVEQRLVVVGALSEVVAKEHPFIRNFFLSDRGRRALQAAKEPLPGIARA